MANDLHLLAVEAGIEPFSSDQLQMRAHLDHTAVLEHEDPVGLADR